MPGGRGSGEPLPVRESRRWWDVTGSMTGPAVGRVDRPDHLLPPRLASDHGRNRGSATAAITSLFRLQQYARTSQTDDRDQHGVFVALTTHRSTSSTTAINPATEIDIDHARMTTIIARHYAGFSPDRIASIALCDNTTRWRIPTIATDCQHFRYRTISCWRLPPDNAHQQQPPRSSDQRTAPRPAHHHCRHHGLTGTTYFDAIRQVLARHPHADGRRSCRHHRNGPRRECGGGDGGPAHARGLRVQGGRGAVPPVGRPTRTKVRPAAGHRLDRHRSRKLASFVAFYEVRPSTRWDRGRTHRRAPWARAGWGSWP